MIIDRFEGEYAVIELEDGRMVNMPRELLPLEAKEGMVINVIVDENRTGEQKKRLKDKMDKLFKD